MVEYHNKNECTQEFMPSLCACKDKNGKILIEDEKVLMRWKECFEDILSDSTTGMNRNTYYTGEPEDILPTLEDVSYVMKSLKRHKAPEAAEVLKYGDEDLWERLHNLIILI